MKHKKFISVFTLLCFIPTAAFADSLNEYNEPVVTSLTLTYFDGADNQTISLLPLDIQPQLTVEASTELIFEVQFDNATRIDKVYITSTIDDEIKYLEAVEEHAGLYKAQGYFDPNDYNYIPGTIGVLYTKKTVAVTEHASIDDDIDMHVLKTQLEDEGVSLQNIKKDDSTDTVTAQVVIESLFNGAEDVYIDASISTFVYENGMDKSELENWLGVYKDLSDLRAYHLDGKNGKQYTVYLDDGALLETDTYLLLVKELTENKYTKLLIQNTADTWGLDDISSKLGQTNYVAGQLYDYLAISKEMDDLREEVENNTLLTKAEKEEANFRIDALENDKKLFLIGTTLLAPLVGTASAPALLFSALVGGITVASDYFWQQRTGMVPGCNPVENLFVTNNPHDGNWRVLTQEFLDENHSCIGTGNYYLAEDISGLVISRASGGNVNICLNGHDIEYVYISNYDINDKGGAYIHDCQYREQSDGTVTGGKIGTIWTPNDSRLMEIDNCIIYSITNQCGPLNIRGGRIASLENAKDSIVNISGGTVGDISNAGSINISGGKIVNTNDRYRNECIWNYDSGTITMSDGVIENEIPDGICIGNAGTFIIENGRIENYDATYLNQPAILNHGILTMDGGNVAAVTGVINDNIFVLNDGTVVGQYNSISNTKNGYLTMSGGTVATKATNQVKVAVSNSGIAEIKGGIITAPEIAIENDDGGTVNVYNGEIRSEELGTGFCTGIINYDGQISIYDGITTGISNFETGNTKIYGGEITGWIQGENAVELIITDKSIIELLFGVESIPILRAGIGYTDDVKYYDKGEYSDGVIMRINELQEYIQKDYNREIFLPHYMRFEGGVVSNNTGNTPVAPPADSEFDKMEINPMYRLYNPNSGEHFYTGSVEERDMLDNVGWMYEGVAWNAPANGGTPIYRLFNPNNSDHHYTGSIEERDMLVNVGWQYEGVCWNSASAGNLPQYRLFNPNADCGSHHYTGSIEERDYLVSLGWHYEGIGWFGIR
ncbi:MAG: hypothetical protein IJA90_07065 [Peptococcaceae bacterium]|nr:hypothetical protein [Peptococcaceae bacterium]